ncbi:hypothetical protein EOD41_10340 [Mucilaginibacter limnophilus]|uniref:Site-specific integrase n=1 Tax=Mucilaginibacter limnophilus TaxID=1932778 RepID=A0A3S2WYE2_9SPHI|nr:site-specific integrase [Mucilaginibacter limnophilus]RVU01013.1 hypothetical protein EOD41_10340 [Mucilaginibacter limnophilus]
MNTNTVNNTFGVNFYLKKNKATKAGLCPIYARITVNGKRRELSVKRSVDPVNWNAAKGMPKGFREDIIKLQKYLDRFKSDIVENYQDLFLQKKLITTDVLKGIMTGGNQSEFTLSKLMQYHNKQQKMVLEWGTMKNYGTTEKYVLKFLQEKFNTTDKYLAELNYQFITDFEYYLRGLKDKNNKSALSNNGVMKHLERLRKMVNLAFRLEWIERNPFVAHKLRFEKTQRQHLTSDELKRLETQKLSLDRHKSVRDMFVFSCYTGLAFTDVMNLTKQTLLKVKTVNYG